MIASFKVLYHGYKETNGVIHSNATSMAFQQDGK